MWWIATLVACGGESNVGTPTAVDPPTDPPVTPPPTGTSPTVVDADGDGAPADADCDDGDPDVYPGAPDVCGDDKVTDCDRTSDDGLVSVGDASYPDLPAAIAAAPPGSTVMVCAGTWPTLGARAVDLTLVAHDGPDATVLEGGEDRVLDTEGDVTVDGFTVTGGNAVEEGGGLRHVGAGTLTVSNARILDNRAGRGAGIAVVDGGALVLVDAPVTDNTATDAGGGLLVRGATADLGATLVSDNRAVNGGGMLLDGATVDGGVVTGNAVEGYGFGGGVFATGAPSAWTGATIRGNEAYYGAGIHVLETTLTLTDASVADNAGDIGDGGGALVERGHLELLGASEIVGNNSGFGGGVKLVDGSLTGGVVRDNRGAWGGGLEVIGASTVDGVSVTGNEADFGGGVDVYFSDAPPTFVDVSVVGNRSEGYGEGGGLYGYAAVDVTAPVVWTGGELRDNTTRATGGGLSIAWFELHLDGVEVVGNAADDAGGGAALSEARLVITGGRVAGNSAAVGGGVRVSGTSTLDVSACDFGADADDNTPEDVSAGGARTSGYGLDATFTCGPSGCTPLP